MTGEKSIVFDRTLAVTTVKSRLKILRGSLLRLDFSLRHFLGRRDYLVWQFWHSGIIGLNSFLLVRLLEVLGGPPTRPMAKSEKRWNGIEGQSS